LDELKALVEEAHSAGRPVAAHAATAEGMRRAVLAGVGSYCSSGGEKAKFFWEKKSTPPFRLARVAQVATREAGWDRKLPRGRGRGSRCTGAS